jgi:hypothetical protein
MSVDHPFGGGRSVSIGDFRAANGYARIAAVSAMQFENRIECVECGALRERRRHRDGGACAVCGYVGWVPAHSLGKLELLQMRSRSRALAPMASADPVARTCRPARAGALLSVLPRGIAARRFRALLQRTA